MALPDALYHHLSNNAGVTAVTSRIRMSQADHSETLPYIVFEQLPSTPVQHMTAASGLQDAAFDIRCYDDDQYDAYDLGELVREALDGFTGTMGSGAGDTAVVRRAMLENTWMEYEEPQDGQEIGKHVARQTWVLWHTQTVPTF